MFRCSVSQMAASRVSEDLTLFLLSRELWGSLFIIKGTSVLRIIRILTSMLQRIRAGTITGSLPSEI